MFMKKYMKKGQKFYYYLKINIISFPKEAKYVYLSSKNETYDFMKGENEIDELSILNKVLENNKEFEIYYITAKEQVYKFLIKLDR